MSTDVSNDREDESYSLDGSMTAPSLEVSEDLLSITSYDQMSSVIQKYGEDKSIDLGTYIRYQKKKGDRAADYITACLVLDARKRLNKTEYSQWLKEFKLAVMNAGIEVLNTDTLRKQADVVEVFSYEDWGLGWTKLVFGTLGHFTPEQCLAHIKEGWSQNTFRNAVREKADSNLGSQPKKPASTLGSYSDPSLTYQPPAKDYVPTTPEQDEALCKAVEVAVAQQATLDNETGEVVEEDTGTDYDSMSFEEFLAHSPEEAKQEETSVPMKDDGTPVTQEDWDTLVYNTLELELDMQTQAETHRKNMELFEQRMKQHADFMDEYDKKFELAKEKLEKANEWLAEYDKTLDISDVNKPHLTLVK